LDRYSCIIKLTNFYIILAPLVLTNLEVITRDGTKENTLYFLLYNEGTISYLVQVQPVTQLEGNTYILLLDYYFIIIQL